jgi:hypothetical protein
MLCGRNSFLAGIGQLRSNDLDNRVLSARATLMDLGTKYLKPNMLFSFLALIYPLSHSIFIDLVNM